MGDKMSGGTFDYVQYRIHDIILKIEEIIKNNGKEDKYGYKTNFSPVILDKFREGIKYLKIAEIYAQRIDWLVAGDDGEESFLERLESELKEIE